MASSINSLSYKTAADSSGSATKTTSAGPSGSLANESTFLQLLVAQLKNQDPENPTDGTQFVAQLAQFSQLEQSIAMRQDLDTMAKATTAASGSSGANGSNSVSNGANNTAATQPA